MVLNEFSSNMESTLNKPPRLDDLFLENLQKLNKKIKRILICVTRIKMSRVTRVFIPVMY